MTLTLQEPQFNEAVGKHKHRPKPMAAAQQDPDEISMVAYQPSDLYIQHAISEPLQMRVKAAVDIFEEDLKRKKMKGHEPPKANSNSVAKEAKNLKIEA